MEQVIRNLIVNAIKFTPAGGSICVTLIDSTAEFVPSHLEVNEPAKHSASASKVHCTSEIQNDTKGPAKHNDRKKKFVVQISDTGVGMTKQQIGHLFGQFVQFNSSALQGGGGSGLGLWICKEIIKQHGGEIYVFSDGPGRGSTISIELDSFLCNTDQFTHDFTNFDTGVNTMAVAASLSLVSYSTSCQGNTKSIPQKTQHVPLLEEAEELKSELKIKSERSKIMRILVVDDSALNRKVLIKMLNKIESTFLENQLNFDIHEAEDGVPALKLLQSSSQVFHIVFIDNIMLNMNGPETAKIMRGTHHFEGKIIGVTGNSMDADVSEFINNGADRVLIKPINREMLQEELKSVNIEDTEEDLCSSVTSYWKDV